MKRKLKLLSGMRNENIYCETACCDLRSLRNSGDSYRVLKLPVVLFLPARKKWAWRELGKVGWKIYDHQRCWRWELWGSGGGTWYTCALSALCHVCSVLFLVVTLLKVPVLDSGDRALWYVGKGSDSGVDHLGTVHSFEAPALVGSGIGHTSECSRLSVFK